MKATLKGFVRNVTPVIIVTPTTSGSSPFSKQSIILFIPGFVNEFQEKVGQDETWEIQLINSAITKHNLLDQNLEQKKVECTIYLNSKSNNSTGEERFNINARLADLKVLD